MKLVYPHSCAAVLFKLTLLVLFSLLFSNRASASATSKIEQQISIIDQEYSTTNTTAQPTDNSVGLVQWLPDNYNDETVYFEVIIYCSSCSGGNAQAQASLYTDSGSVVSGTTLSTTNSSYTRVRSSDITSNLSSSEEYTVRVALDASAGTAYIQSARLIIVQDGEPISDTLTHVEVGNNTSTTGTSYTVMSGPKIFLWDEDVHTDLAGVYFEATLNGSDATATSYATLSSASDCSSTVSGSEITSTNTTWTRQKSADIKSNLVDDTEYWVCTHTTSSDTGYIANAKLIIEQSNSLGINVIETYQQYINAPRSDSDSTYTSGLFLNLLDPDNFSSDILEYYFESTLQSSSGTGYARLYNSTDTSSITGSEVSYNSSSFSRQRSQDITTNLPGTAKELDTQLRNGTTNTTTASTSWLIIRIDDVLDASLSFEIAGTLASQVFNGITTSSATEIDGLSFGNVSIGEPKYISHMLTVSTNAPSGYNVNMKLDTYMQGLYPANNLDGFPAPWNAPTTWTEPTGQIINQDTGWFGANTTDTRVTGWSSGSELFGAVNNSSHTVMTSTAADTGTTAYVTYGLEVNELQPADLYSGTISYTVLPTY